MQCIYFDTMLAHLQPFCPLAFRLQYGLPNRRFANCHFAYYVSSPTAILPNQPLLLTLPDPTNPQTLGKMEVGESSIGRTVKGKTTLGKMAVGELTFSLYFPS